MLEVLVKARASTGMKQADVGKIIGRHQSYISNIERGERRLDVVEFHELVEAMGFDSVKMYRKIVSIIRKINS